MSRRPAVTLLELVLVLAVLILFAFLTFPSLEAMAAGHRMNAGLDSTRTAWVTAQARASEEGRPYRFAVIPGHGNWRIAPDNDAYWTGGAAPTEETEMPALIQEDYLPKGVRFVSPTGDEGDSGSDDTILPLEAISPAQWVTVGIFLPDGTAKDDIHVGLKSRGVPLHRMQLRAMTGVIDIKRPGLED